MYPPGGYIPSLSLSIHRVPSYSGIAHPIPGSLFCVDRIAVLSNCASDPAVGSSRYLPIALAEKDDMSRKHHRHHSVKLQYGT